MFYHFHIIVRDQPDYEIKKYFISIRRTTSLSPTEFIELDTALRTFDSQF